MDKDSALYQLMGIRISSALDKITQEDTLYQETGRESDGYYQKLEELHLPDEVMLLVSRYASAHNANGSRYGELAYLLGFSDCVELLFGTPCFPNGKADRTVSS